MNFASDNVYGVDPRILQAMVDANSRLTDVSYCHDDGSREVEARLSQIFEKDVKAFLVVNGTGANSLALSAICPTFGGVFCHEMSHINTDECNCPELFMGGGKLITMPGKDAKLTPAVFAEKLSQFGHGEHGAKPCALSITSATELGTVYTPAEIKALADVAKPRGMKVHMDGARFANALVSLGCTPAEMTWKAGVDVLSFGGTKNGGMILEAVVFFDTALAEDFLYRRKRTGQLVSKGRFLSAQMLAYLQDDVWLPNARRANTLAQTLAKGMQASNRVRLTTPVEANEIFAIMPRKLFDALQAKGANFYDWPWDGLADDEVHCRFVVSFATPAEHVDRFLQLIRETA
ncbi:threonine aldolase family protein [Aestuariivirga sp.]|uniref:threonine aldolase family protein n=1 Tax=Aestuariivirga sp. TaxID=2650926 RepID=UPI0039E4C1AC